MVITAATPLPYETVGMNTQVCRTLSDCRGHRMAQGRNGRERTESKRADWDVLTHSAGGRTQVDHGVRWLHKGRYLGQAFNPIGL